MADGPAEPMRPLLRGIHRPSCSAPAWPRSPPPAQPVATAPAQPAATASHHRRPRPSSTARQQCDRPAPNRARAPQKPDGPNRPRRALRTGCLEPASQFLRASERGAPRNPEPERRRSPSDASPRRRVDAGPEGRRDSCGFAFTASPVFQPSAISFAESVPVIELGPATAE